jgi:antitoxin VapB
MSKLAKIFKNGRSQAVRLPAEFRFDCSEVYVRREPETGDIILSRKPDSWDDFFALLDDLEIPSDFMIDRKQPRQDRKAL